MRRDGRNHSSPNSGIPEAAAGGALGIRLGGTNVYSGIPVVKPTEELAGRLLTKHILIRNCGNFAGLNNRFFRVAVRGREENDRLLAALAAAVS
jgi:hypothetical protein